ncbi:hypothetical protein OGAPHI_007006 [Ogataea philodendri]|uniref:ENTH domain-containing protein n=1 Tax=Ogataea philodendri TaxID=1378263 RepID=A0A9P8NVE4_9ASCO|nr:uncharacterized protein OGAPHI_007006 [Ogataea philodendri]KAH3660420.1 hypothetical protein OGAPHI_007006 [Ogataea philodendri]
MVGSGQSISKLAIDFIVNRIQEYAYPQRSSQTILGTLKKTLVTRGYEFVTVSKCLQLLEYLLLNCYQEEDGAVIFDIVDDIRVNLDPLALLNNYHVGVCYDGLDMNHEKQIKEMAKNVVELATDDSKLAREREKYRPKKSERQNSGTLFYDEDQFDLNQSDSLRLQEDQNPFGKSTISSISSNVARYLPSSPGHRKSQSGGISLASQNYSYSTYHDQVDENHEYPREPQHRDESPDSPGDPSQGLLIDLNS